MKRLLHLYNLIISRLFTRPRHYKVLLGPLKNIYLYMPLSFGVMKYLGIYELEQAKFVNNLIKEGYYCVDMGSHVGSMTLLMAKLAGNSGKIWSFEPLNQCCLLLEGSLQKNNFKNTVIINSGLSDKLGKKQAYVFNDSGMAHFDKDDFVIEKSMDTKVLELVTLDGYFEENKISKLDFVKVDVEGYEYKALLGAFNTIKRFSPQMLIEIHSKDNQKNVYRLLDELGYKIFDLNNNLVDRDKEFEHILYVYATKQR
ncbi:FkbM family methyltransferase [Patescibacteria group bacterium]